MIRIAGIFFWNNKAYLPVIGRTEVDFYWEAGPIFTSDMTIEALSTALDEIVKVGNPPMRHPTQAEFRKATSIEKALGMRSWRRMAKAGVIRCVVSWEEGKIIVAFSPRNARDVGEIDTEHEKDFPLDTPMCTIAEYVLHEVQMRRKEQGASSEPPLPVPQ